MLLPSPEAIADMSVSQLRALLTGLQAQTLGETVLEKSELVSLAQVSWWVVPCCSKRALSTRLPSQSVAAAAGGTKYDLVCNVVHDLPPDTSERKCVRRCLRPPRVLQDKPAPCTLTPLQGGHVSRPDRDRHVPRARGARPLLDVVRAPGASVWMMAATDTRSSE